MIVRQGKPDRRGRLPWLAAVCLVLAGLALNLYLGASGDPSGHLESLIVAAPAPDFEADLHHSGPGHGGAEHCLSGPGCTSAAILPVPGLVGGDRPAPMLIGADRSPRVHRPLPPLRPPDPAAHG